MKKDKGQLPVVDDSTNMMMLAPQSETTFRHNCPLLPPTYPTAPPTRRRRRRRVAWWKRLRRRSTTTTTTMSIAASAAVIKDDEEETMVEERQNINVALLRSSWKQHDVDDNGAMEELLQESAQHEQPQARARQQQQQQQKPGPMELWFPALQQEQVRDHQEREQEGRRQEQEHPRPSVDHPQSSCSRAQQQSSTEQQPRKQQPILLLLLQRKHPPKALRVVVSSRRQSSVPWQIRHYHNDDDYSEYSHDDGHYPRQKEDVWVDFVPDTVPVRHDSIEDCVGRFSEQQRVEIYQQRKRRRSAGRQLLQQWRAAQRVQQQQEQQEAPLAHETNHAAADTIQITNNRTVLVWKTRHYLHDDDDEDLPNLPPTLVPQSARQNTVADEEIFYISEQQRFEIMQKQERRRNIGRLLLKELHAAKLEDQEKQHK